MNTKHLQFNRQKVAALLLAGSILAASLAWTGAEASGSTLQPTNAGQTWSQPEFMAGSKLGSGTDGVTVKGGESGLSSESQHSLIAGRKPGVGMGDSQPPSKPS